MLYPWIAERLIEVYTQRRDELQMYIFIRLCSVNGFPMDQIGVPLPCCIVVTLPHVLRVVEGDTVLQCSVVNVAKTVP